MPAGTIKNPCKCAGCSLQKAAINISILYMITHGLFCYGIYYFYNDIYELAKRVGFEGDSFYYPTEVKSHNSIQANQRHILISYLILQYLVLPGILHCSLFCGALMRSKCCCSVWIVFTSQYLVADLIFKFYVFKWYGLLYSPLWIFDIYCIWVLKRFKQEIVMYGPIILPIRPVKCPYYFKKPKDYDPKSNFVVK